jgi:predicted nucleic acid-binding protein
VASDEPARQRVALDLHQTRSLGYYDALIVAGAQVSGCTTLCSEDMNASERVNGVRMVNPFAGS